MYKGFTIRLFHELIDMITNKGDYAELEGLKNQFQCVHSPFPSNYLCWLGASILGSLESTINTSNLTLENYQNNNSVNINK